VSANSDNVVTVRVEIDPSGAESGAGAVTASLDGIGTAAEAAGSTGAAGLEQLNVAAGETAAAFGNVEVQSEAARNAAAASFATIAESAGGAVAETSALDAAMAKLEARGSSPRGAILAITQLKIALEAAKIEAAAMGGATVEMEAKFAAAQAEIDAASLAVGNFRHEMLATRLDMDLAAGNYAALESKVGSTKGMLELLRIEGGETGKALGSLAMAGMVAYVAFEAINKMAEKGAEAFAKYQEKAKTTQEVLAGGVTVTENLKNASDLLALGLINVGAAADAGGKKQADASKLVGDGIHVLQTGYVNLGEASTATQVKAVQQLEAWSEKVLASEATLRKLYDSMVNLGVTVPPIIQHQIDLFDAMKLSATKVEPSVTAVGDAAVLMGEKISAAYEKSQQAGDLFLIENSAQVKKLIQDSENLGVALDSTLAMAKTRMEALALETSKVGPSMAAVSVAATDMGVKIQAAYALGQAAGDRFVQNHGPAILSILKAATEQNVHLGESFTSAATLAEGFRLSLAKVPVTFADMQAAAKLMQAELSHQMFQNSADVGAFAEANKAALLSEIAVHDQLIDELGREGAVRKQIHDDTIALDKDSNAQLTAIQKQEADNRKATLAEASKELHDAKLLDLKAETDYVAEVERLQKTYRDDQGNIIDDLTVYIQGAWNKRALAQAEYAAKVKEIQAHISTDEKAAADVAHTRTLQIIDDHVATIAEIVKMGDAKRDEAVQALLIGDSEARATKKAEDAVRSYIKAINDQAANVVLLAGKEKDSVAAQDALIAAVERAVSSYERAAEAAGNDGLAQAQALRDVTQALVPLAEKYGMTVQELKRWVEEHKVARDAAIDHKAAEEGVAQAVGELAIALAPGTAGLKALAAAHHDAKSGAIDDKAAAAAFGEGLRSMSPITAEAIIKLQGFTAAAEAAARAALDAADAFGNMKNGLVAVDAQLDMTQAGLVGVAWKMREVTKEVFVLTAAQEAQIEVMAGLAAQTGWLSLYTKHYLAQLEDGEITIEQFRKLVADLKLTNIQAAATMGDFSVQLDQLLAAISKFK
jgi:hypothetical protein